MSPHNRPSLPRLSAAVLAVSLASNGLGQSGPSLPPSNRKQSTPETAFRQRLALIGQRFAECVYQRSQRLADAILTNSDAGTVDYKKAGLKQEELSNSLNMEACFLLVGYDERPMAIKITGDRIRSMLEEEAYLAAHKTPPKLADGATEFIAHNFVSKGGDLEKAQVFAAFSDCLIFRDTAGSDALLRTPPDSPAERVAAVAMAPALGQCMTQGNSVSLTLDSIRLFARDGLYARYVATANARPESSIK